MGYSLYTQYTTTVVVQAADPECAAWRAEQKLRWLPPAKEEEYKPQGRVLTLGGPQ